MSFHEVTYSDELSYGASSGPQFKTMITELRSGAEQRVSRWSAPRRLFNLAYGDKTHVEVALQLEFAIMRNGSEFGFRLKDWMDFNSSSLHISAILGGADADDEDQVIGTGDGTETQFQLIKTYADGIASAKVRNIKKPRAGSVLIAIDGAAQTEGVDFSVDTTTGIIDFAVAPLLAEIITAGYQFDVPVRFTQSAEKWVQGTIASYNNASANLEAIEILDNELVPGEFWMGGSNTFSFAKDTPISLLAGRNKVATATVTSLSLLMPPSSGLPSGGPFFYIIGGVGTEDFELRSAEGTLFATITAGDIAEILLLDDGSWLAR